MGRDCWEVSLRGDENVLKLDRGDGCTRLCKSTKCL